MSNNGTQLKVHNRAMIAGALVGGIASGVENWKRQQQGEQSIQETTCKVVKDAAKAGVVSGAAMYVANATAGRPVLTMLTVLSTAAAGLYLIDSIKGNKNEQPK
ncbi:hypothetical protein [Neisseria sp. Ec49-e6-T10]|uniref:hypothetical protein n=1 Tax=Neisseria sp. Ec49-e6-T10 TaxID=3140744 RepID=UPI003EBD2169